MKPVHEMSAAEALEEATRRQANRAAGRSLTAMPPGALRVPGKLDRVCGYCQVPMRATDERCPVCFRVPLEDDEQEDVRRLYLAYGCVVFATSQKRRSKISEGIPDLYVLAPRVGMAGWHETKRAQGGVLSPAQREFRDFCVACAVPWCAGGLLEARRRLVRWQLAEWVDGVVDGDIEPIRAAPCP